jgi:ABC-type branched-subunit amino acid transport system substrate-binding protein
VLKVVYQVRPDIIVLASGDADFVPLIQEVRKSGVRVEVAAFEEAAGAGTLLKCSGFIDLAVYYEDYLAAQNSEQNEDSIEEQYKNLIQSQNGEQDEDDLAEQVQDLLQSHDGDLKKDDVKLSVDQVGNQTGVPATDIIDEL